MTPPKIQPEIAAAVAQGRPVVAMESTVYSYLGLPDPFNRQTYDQSVEAVEQAGALPAVTAVLDGQPKVGLNEAEMERVLNSKPGESSGSSDLSESEVKKVGMGDLPVAVAQGCPIGATTVSASLALAHQAGLKVFATGGIGGVHRENPTDVSADLHALARFPLATVCSGIKAFLNLPATLELLETLGVAVVGYQTSEFPAFWCAESGISLSYRVDSPAEAAAIVAELGDSGSSAVSPGVVFAVPPPSEMALPWSEISPVVDVALEKIQRQEVQGKDATPFILSEISEATQGRTLPVNMALVANNAKVAAEISFCLSQI